MSHVLYYLCCYSTTTRFLPLIFMRLFCGSLTHILPVAPARLFTGWRRDVAERKARLLLDAGANVTVNALDFTPQFQVWADSQMLTLVQGSLSPLLDNCWLAIAATDDETVNQQVSEAAEARRIFCNVVDAPRQPALSCRRSSIARR